MSNTTIGQTIQVSPSNNALDATKGLKVSYITWKVEDKQTGKVVAFSDNVDKPFDLLPRSGPSLMDVQITCEAFDIVGLRKLKLSASSTFSKDLGVLFTDETSPVNIGKFVLVDTRNLSIEKHFTNYLIGPNQEVFITFVATFTNSNGIEKTGKLVLRTTASELSK